MAVPGVRSTGCLTPKGGRSSVIVPSPSAPNHHKSKILLPIIKFLMIGSILCLALHYALDYSGFNAAFYRSVTGRSTPESSPVLQTSGGGGASTADPVQGVANGNTPGTDVGTVGAGSSGGGTSGAGGTGAVVRDAALAATNLKGALLVAGTFQMCPRGSSSTDQRKSMSSAYGELARLFLKNKVDYAGHHGLSVWPFLGDLQVKEAPSLPEWTKIAILNYLWQSHTEREWFLWIDGSIMVLDMAFDIPWSKYKGFDVVLWGNEPEVFIDVTRGGRAQCKGVDTAVLLVRRSKWARKLLKEMLSLQRKVATAADSGQTMADLRAVLSDLPPDGVFTPECALSYLVANSTEWRRKIYFEKEHSLNAPWTDALPTLEDYIAQPSDGVGSSPTAAMGTDLKSKEWVGDGRKPPFLVSFAGCNFCAKNTGTDDGKTNFSSTSSGSNAPEDSPENEECAKGIRKAFAFGNNQVVAALNLRYKSLYDTWVVPIKSEEETTQAGIPIAEQEHVSDLPTPEAKTANGSSDIDGGGNASEEAAIAKENASASPPPLAAEEASPNSKGAETDSQTGLKEDAGHKEERVTEERPPEQQRQLEGADRDKAASAEVHTATGSSPVGDSDKNASPSASKDAVQGPPAL